MQKQFLLSAIAAGYVCTSGRMARQEAALDM
jgi:hypothetical protein